MRIEIINRASFRAKTPEDDALLRQAHAEGATIGIKSAIYIGEKMGPWGEEMGPRGEEMGPWEGDKAFDMSTTTLHEPEARVWVSYPGYDGIPGESRGSFSAPLPEGCSVPTFALFAMSRVRPQK